jgi:hypothetical protein
MSWIFIPFSPSAVADDASSVNGEGIGVDKVGVVVDVAATRSEDVSTVRNPTPYGGQRTA